MTVPAAVYTAIVIHFARKCLAKCLTPCRKNGVKEISLPIIRKCFPELLAPKLISVKMSGSEFALRYASCLRDTGDGYCVASDSPDTLNIEWHRVAPPK